MLGKCNAFFLVIAKMDEVTSSVPNVSFWVTAMIDGKCWGNVMPPFWLLQKWMKSQAAFPMSPFG